MTTGRDFTREEYENMTKYKKLFFDVIRLHCRRALRPSELKELYDQYIALGYQPINTNCSYCVFEMCETLAKRYFYFQEQDVKEEVTGIIRSRRGRKTNGTDSVKKEVKKERNKPVQDADRRGKTEDKVHKRLQGKED